MRRHSIIVDKLAAGEPGGTGMSDQEITIFVVLVFVLVVPLTLGLALWLVARARQKADRPASADEIGGVTVPVRGLTRYFRVFGHSQNSINPRLAIIDDGLRFKVFKPDHWLLADIAGVDAPWSPFVTRLAFRHRREGELWIDLAGKPRAAEFLRLLPASLPFTKRALALRGDPV